MLVYQYIFRAKILFLLENGEMNVIKILNVGLRRGIFG
jgi:hypothetical protein